MVFVIPSLNVGVGSRKSSIGDGCRIKDYMWRLSIGFDSCVFDDGDRRCRAERSVSCGEGRGGGHLYFVDLRDECGGGANEESFLDQHFGL